jgi:hypothetical protein
MVNGHPDSPFLTSDFPSALEVNEGEVIHNRIVRLAPNLALRIIPNYEAAEDKENFDLRFQGLRWRVRQLSRKEVQHVNTLLVRCAEELVFCPGRLDWIFVRRNGRYELTTRITKVPSADGTYLIAQQMIAEKERAGAGSNEAKA